MAEKGFKPYWIFPQDGDPVPEIGSGFRRVWVEFSSKRHVRVKISLDDLQATHISTRRWKQVPQVEDTGQPMAAVFNWLRHPDFNDAPCRNGRCNFKG